VRENQGLVRSGVEHHLRENLPGLYHQLETCKWIKRATVIKLLIIVVSAALQDEADMESMDSVWKAVRERTNIIIDTGGRLEGL